MTGRTRAWLAVGLLYLGLAGSVTSLHAVEVNFGPKAHKRAHRHADIIELSGGRKPWAFRVAVPLVVEHPLEDILDTVGVSKAHTREYGYLLVRFASTWLTILLSHLLIARFTRPALAVAGALLVGALHGPSIAHYWFQPASGPDHVLWLAAALLTLSRRDGWLYPLIFLGAWNRETIVFVVPIYLALRWGTEPTRRTLERAVVLGLLWVLPFVWLRGTIELSPRPTSTPVQHLLRNLRSFEWQWYALCFAGAWAAVPLLGWRHLPAPLRRLMWVMVPYLGLVLAFGRIREVRLLLPLTVAFVPATMVVLQRWLDALDPAPPPSGQRKVNAS